MRTFKYIYYEIGLKDLLAVLYVVAVLVTGLTALIEFKIEYDIDFFPGIDIPIDEWYEATFH